MEKQNTSGDGRGQGRGHLQGQGQGQLQSQSQSQSQSQNHGHSQSHGHQPDLAATFRHAGVAEAYRCRPPYPGEVFDVLERLVVDQPRRVLDLGAGEGALARPLAERSFRVDAVDISAAMIRAGRLRPGGDHPSLRWIVGSADEADLDGPYALATAGASLHWLPWERTAARLLDVLTANAVLAVIGHGYADLPWREPLREVIVRHSRNPDFDPGHSPVDSLAERGLFEIRGRHETGPGVFRQPVADYVEQFHSTASLARELMPGPEAAAFDDAVERIVRPYAEDGVLTMDVTAEIVWGRPR